MTRAGRTIDLQPREFQLLELLMRHPGQVMTRTMLLETVWDYHFDPQTNVIDVHISRLRQKIDRGFEVPLIHTVRGAGIVSVRLKRLLETSTFRLALIYLALFGVSALALLGFLYGATAGFIEHQTAETIQAEITGLAEQYRAQGLTAAPGDRAAQRRPSAARQHLPADRCGGRPIAGNLDRWPEVEPGPDGWLTFTSRSARWRQHRAPPGAGSHLPARPTASGCWSGARSRTACRPSR